MNESASFRLIEQQLARHYLPDRRREYTAALVWCRDRMQRYTEGVDCVACRVLADFRQEFLVPAVA